MSRFGDPVNVAMLPDETPRGMEWIAQKNLASAQVLARAFGGRVVWHTVGSKENTIGFGMYPMTTIEASENGYTEHGYYYGGVVEDMRHADKGILHELAPVSQEAPQWYRPDVAAACPDAVMPGYTAFSAEGAQKAMELLQEWYGPRVRLKPSDAERGEHQSVVHNRDELLRQLGQLPDLAGVGVVLEPHLSELVRLPVTFLHLAGQAFSWLGQQHVEYWDTREVYRGITIVCVKGDASKLGNAIDDKSRQLAIRQAAAVHRSYGLLGATISRGTYDVLQGITDNGTWLSGITDPSLRPAASTPAEVRAIAELMPAHDSAAITVDMVHHYGHNRPLPKDDSVFVDTSRVTITTVVRGGV